VKVPGVLAFGSGLVAQPPVSKSELTSANADTTIMLEQHPNAHQLPAFTQKTLTSVKFVTPTGLPEINLEIIKVSTKDTLIYIHT
jgi:hypothetical protein